MKIITTSLIAGLMLAASSVSAFAGSGMPNNYESAASKYIGSRLVDERGAQYRLSSRPYEVQAKLKNGKTYDCWAVDMRVRMDNGGVGRGMDRYTVIFHKGKAVALKRDLRTRLVKLDNNTRLASN